MSDPITFPGAVELTVDLLGREYTLCESTKSVVAKAAALYEQLGEVTDNDGIVALYGDLIDLRLRPTGQQRKKASEVIREQWDADKISVAQIEAFIARIGEAEEAARPT